MGGGVGKHTAEVDLETETDVPFLARSRRMIRPEEIEVVSGLCRSICLTLSISICPRLSLSFSLPIPLPPPPPPPPAPSLSLIPTPPHASTYMTAHTTRHVRVGRCKGVVCEFSGRALGALLAVVVELEVALGAVGACQFVSEVRTPAQTRQTRERGRNWSQRQPAKPTTHTR